MKQTTLTILLTFLFSLTLSAQFAIVVDEGGFVNVYDEEKEELDRLGSDGVVAIESVDDEWALVDYTKYGEYAASSGYVKRKNLIDIHSLKEIPLIVDAEHHITLANDDISICIHTQEFDSLAHKITYFAEGHNDITAINGAEYWGTKSGLPSHQYASITYKRDEESIEFPDKVFSNLFNPHINLAKAYYDEENEIVYLVVISGDITGAYTTVWVIEEGEYSIHYVFD